jgi:hypothetical protein
MKSPGVGDKLYLALVMVPRTMAAASFEDMDKLARPASLISNLDNVRNDLFDDKTTAAAATSVPVFVPVCPAHSAMFFDADKSEAAVLEHIGQFFPDTADKSGINVINLVRIGTVLTPSLPVDPVTQNNALYSTAAMCSLPLIEIELSIGLGKAPSFKPTRSVSASTATAIEDGCGGGGGGGGSCADKREERRPRPGSRAQPGVRASSGAWRARRRGRKAHTRCKVNPVIEELSGGSRAFPWNPCIHSPFGLL